MIIIIPNVICWMKNVPIGSDIWTLANLWHCLGCLGGVAMLEEACHWGWALRVWAFTLFLVYSLCFVLMAKNVSLSILLLKHSLLLVPSNHLAKQLMRNSEGKLMYMPSQSWLFRPKFQRATPSKLPCVTNTDVNNSQQGMDSSLEIIKQNKCFIPRVSWVFYHSYRKVTDTPNKPLFIYFFM